MNTLKQDARNASVAVATVWVLHSPRGYAQGQAKSTSFEIMETSIDEVLAAFQADKLTAHQLVQRYLDRIDAYDKRGPTINSVITVNPQALAEADRLDAAYRVGPCRPAAWHSDPG
jgi:hypothetical protein